MLAAAEAEAASADGKPDLRLAIFASVSPTFVFCKNVFAPRLIYNKYFKRNL